MDRDRYQRLCRVVHDASERPDSERRAFVESACGGDAAMAARALELLRAAEPSTQALGAGWDPPAPVELKAGRVLGGCRLVSEIGRGGMGVVWRARDEATGDPVAIKVFHAHLAADARAVERFRREAQIGLAVVHDNVVRALRFGTEEVDGATVPFLVLELVVGRTLRRLLDDLGTVPEALLREIAVQTATGLAAIHAAGAVHRDVKPENVFLADDERVRILDLGVAKVRDVSTELTHEGHFVGSLHYAAPEQSDGRDVGPAADLYALGVVLHELAVGENPFVAPTLAAIVQRHREHVPERVSARNPAVSAFLSEVIAALLAKRPERRFASARELVSVLTAGERGPWWRERTEARGARSRPRLSPGRTTALRGRDAELAALVGAWDDACAGRGRVVLVEGDAGVGKSRLVDAWLDRSDAEDADLLVASYAPERGRGGLRDAIVQRFGGDAVDARVAALLADAPGLAEAFAAMLRDEGAPLGPAGLAAALTRIVRGLAAERPVVWVVEDLHFADPPSLALLAAVVRGLAETRSLFVLTSRPAADPAAWDRLARLPQWERIAVGPLDAADVARLVADALGCTDAADVPRRVARAVAERSGGVPLFALQVLQDLRSRGQVVQAAGGAWIEARRIESVETPPALREALRARLDGLSRDERAVLDVASLLGASFDPGLVARVRGTSRIATLEVLGHLERRHGLVRSDASRCRFDHRLLQEVVAADLPAGLRSELNAAIADALAERGGVRPDRPEDAPPELARRIVGHALDGSDPDRWLPLVPRALVHLHATLAHDEAVAVCAKALARPALGSGAARVPFLVEQARHVVSTGRTDLAAAALAEAVRLAEGAGDDALRLSALTPQAHAFLSVGDYDAALGACDAAEEIAMRRGDDVARTEALSVRGQVQWCRGRYEEGRRCHARAAQIARARGDVLREGRALSNAAVIDHELGYLDRAEADLRRALELLRSQPHRQSLVPATTNLGNVLHDMGRDAEALRQYEATLALCGEFAYREAEAVAWVNVADVRLHLGDVERALGAYAQSLAICDEIDSPRIAGYAHAGLGLARAWSGDADAARTELETAREIRRALGQRPGWAEATALLGWLAKERGDADEARSLLDEAVAAAAECDDVSTQVRAAAWRMALPGGDAAPVLDLLERAGRRLRHDVRMEVRHLLWERTGDRRHLDEARHLLAVTRAHAPTDAPPEGSPLHRAIDAAGA